MTTLEHYARHYNTDKRSHGYLPVYEPLFKPFKYSWRPVILEIGVLAGESLRLWKDWFSHAASIPTVVGIDNRLMDNVGLAMAKAGIEIELADAGEYTAMDAIGSRWRPHIVIDDGSHLAADQETALEALWPHLRPGGLYIIEDLHTAYWKGYGSILGLLTGDWIGRMNGHGEESLTDGIASVRFWPGLAVIEKSYFP
jgi:hypothetical protein